MIVIAIAMLAVSPTKQSGEFVFANFINESGWDSPFIAFMTGILGMNWGYSCLDACTHLAEEIPHPERNIPKAILYTVLIGFLTSFIFMIAVFFSIQDVDSVILTPTYVPSLELFRQALNGNIGGACFMEFLIVAVAAGCLMSIHTWEARLLWSFSRDKGFIFHKYLSRVASQPIGIPLWAHVFSTIWIGILGCLYLASSTAFNSLVTGCILLQYISYVIPVIFLMLKKRNIVHGPFWLGKFGWVCNSVLLIWATMAMIFWR